MGLIVGHKSHRGQVRELNEDSCCALISPDTAPDIDAVLAVADGMGGYKAGEVASQYVTDTLGQLFSSSIYQQWVDYNPNREDYYAAVLKEVLERMNERLYTLASIQSDFSGMGTTATVALLTGQRLFIGHVGDSRAYLLRDGQLRQLTRDHSWVAEQVQAGAMTPEQADQHPRKNVLTRALGNSLVLRVDRSIHAVQPGDVLILCTDGLTNVVSEPEIQQIIEAHRELQVACDYLVDLANQRGGPDNITVLAARLTAVRESPVPPETVRPLKPPAQKVDQAADTLKIKHGTARGVIGPIVSWLLSLVVMVIASGAVGWIAARSLSPDQLPKLPSFYVVWIIVGLGTFVGTVVGIMIAIFILSGSDNQ